jgi:CRP-like cAMP-binding protein
MLEQGQVARFALFSDVPGDKLSEIERLCDIVEVKLEVTKKPIVLETAVPGEILGWSALVSPNQLTAIAQCAELTQVFALPAVKLKAMLDTDPALGYTIMAKMAQIISRRLHSLTARLIEAWGEAFGVDTM